MEAGSRLVLTAVFDKDDNHLNFSDGEAEVSISANGTVDSRFTNEYVPGTATISLIAQKTLDGRIPADGQFSFELLQNGEVIETVSNNAAGMVTFDTLVFKTPDTYTYQIREVRGEDESINYDSHVETITITVEDDGQRKFDCYIFSRRYNSDFRK